MFLEFHMNTFSFSPSQLDLPALSDNHFLIGLVITTLRNILNLVYDVIALEDFAENNMFSIEPSSNGGSDEKLDRLARALRKWSSGPTCDPLVSFPEFAMDIRPFLLCLSLKFSSLNLAP